MKNMKGLAVVAATAAIIGACSTCGNRVRTIHALQSSSSLPQSPHRCASTTTSATASAYCDEAVSKQPRKHRFIVDSSSLEFSQEITFETKHILTGRGGVGLTKKKNGGSGSSRRRLLASVENNLSRGSSEEHSAPTQARGDDDHIITAKDMTSLASSSASSPVVVTNGVKANGATVTRPRATSPVMIKATPRKQGTKRASMTKTGSVGNRLSVGLSNLSKASRGRPSKFKSSSPFPSSELLTVEDEKDITESIRRFRAAVRSRDQLSEFMTRDMPQWTLPLQPSKSSSRRTAIRAVKPSEDQWASSCSMSVEQLRDVMNRGQEARTKLITGNVGLVTMIAKRYYGIIQSTSVGGARGQAGGSSGGYGGVDTMLKLDDLVQEGYMGIMEAAERFDPSRGFRFSTYATHWIRQRIVRSIAECSRVIRLPVHVQAMIRNMHKTQKQLEQKVGRSPSLPELAHELDVPLDKLRLYQHLSRTVLSLEVSADRETSPDDRQRTLSDRIASTEAGSTPYDDAVSESLKSEVHAILDNALGPKEKAVLVHRFGLEEVGSSRTLRETADNLGMTIDAVRAAEARALNKLRQPRMKQRLRDHVSGMPEFERAAAKSMEGHLGFNGYGVPVTTEMETHLNKGKRSKKTTKRPTPESIWSF